MSARGALLHATDVKRPRGKLDARTVLPSLVWRKRAARFQRDAPRRRFLFGRLFLLAVGFPLPPGCASADGGLAVPSF